VAHIYPFCSLENKEEDIFGARHTFWDLLKNFWPEEKVAAWEAELFPRGIHEIGIERVYNLITLSATAHRDWNRGAFALKPISVYDNNTTLEVQFFWQKKQKDTQSTMSLLTTPFSTKDLDRNEGAFDTDTGKVRLLDGRDKIIKSGDFFELKTDNAIERPLPSFKLLEMQWFLQRVIGMAGAAGPYEDWLDEDSDEDEEMCNPGLDEVGDASFLFTNPSLPDSPQFLRGDTLPVVEGSKHHTGEAEGDETGDGDGARVSINC
jgi:HNH endonuclease